MPDMLVRLKRGKTNFEVLTREGSVTKYREKALKSLDDVLVSGDDIFTNISKGEKASKEQLLAAFKTEDSRSVMEEIVTKGEVHLSANERKDMIAQKRAEIVAYINKNYIDAVKALPIPITRIENALDQIRPRIDLDQSAERQVAAMHDKLISVLPLRKGSASITGKVTVPHQFQGVASGIVRKHGAVLGETYGTSSTTWTLEVHSYDELLKDLSRATKGEYNFVVEGEQTSAEAGTSSAEPQRGSGKKAKKKGRR